MSPKGAEEPSGLRLVGLGIVLAAAVIIPLVSDGNGSYRCSWSGGDVEVHTEDELNPIPFFVPVRFAPLHFHGTPSTSPLRLSAS